MTGGDIVSRPAIKILISEGLVHYFSWLKLFQSHKVMVRNSISDFFNFKYLKVYVDLRFAPNKIGLTMDVMVPSGESNSPRASIIQFCPVYSKVVSNLYFTGLVNLFVSDSYPM